MEKADRTMPQRFAESSGDAANPPADMSTYVVWHDASCMAASQVITVVSLAQLIKFQWSVFQGGIQWHQAYIRLLTLQEAITTYMSSQVHAAGRLPFQKTLGMSITGQCLPHQKFDVPLFGFLTARRLARNPAANCQLPADGDTRAAGLLITRNAYCTVYCWVDCRAALGLVDLI